MASAKKRDHTPKKFCSILNWVESRDPDFSDAIRQLCLGGLLSAGKHTAGVTFLYPADDKYRHEIVDKAFSEQAEEAVKMIESLILPVMLLSPADFKREEGVGSRLGFAYQVDRDKSAGRVVRLESAELAPADDYVPLVLEGRPRNTAVWYIKSGRLPTSAPDGRKTWQMPRPSRGPGGPGGRGGPGAHGGARGRYGGGSGRAEIAEAVERKFEAGLRSESDEHPYLASAVSLLNYLKAKHPSDYQKVLPLLDYDPIVTFYLLLEPYKVRGEYLLPDTVVGRDGWNGTTSYSNAVDEYRKFFDDAAEALPQKDVSPRVDTVRKSLLGAADGNPRQLPKRVCDAYASLRTNNMIDGLGPIYSPETLAALGGDKKLWQDELRFLMTEAFKSLRADFNADDWMALLGNLRSNWSGNDYTQELCLTSQAMVDASVAPRQDILMLMRFVNSTDFLYLPVNSARANAKTGGAAADLDDWRVYDRNSSVNRELERYGGMAHTDGISAAALQELDLYYRRHGHLPSAVMSMVER